MSDSEGTGTGTASGPDEVGSVADEAAKLLDALSGWAREQSSGAGEGVSDVASAASAAFHNANEHFATGGPDCTYCPICRVVHVVRETSPEVRTHLALAALNLMQAASAVLETTLPGQQKSGARAEDLQKIDLEEDDWPDED